MSANKQQSAKKIKNEPKYEIGEIVWTGLLGKQLKITDSTWESGKWVYSFEETAGRLREDQISIIKNDESQKSVSSQKNNTVIDVEIKKCKSFLKDDVGQFMQTLSFTRGKLVGLCISKPIFDDMLEALKRIKGITDRFSIDTMTTINTIASEAIDKATNTK